jgi:hypothetical protein
MPNYQNPSETAKGKTEEFYLQVARGHIPNHSFVHKFGAVPAMSVNTTGTIWDISDTIYPWTTWSSAGTVSVSTVNASDDGKTITIEGLDANYLPQTENIVVSSSAAVTSTKSYIRLYKAHVSVGVTNVGDIDIQKSATTVLRITADKGQTLMAIYTVPAGKIGYLIKETMTVAANADATGDMYVRYFGQTSFRIGHTFEVSGTGGQYSYDFGIPITIPEKSDIDFRASVRSNNARVTAAFDILLIDS